MTVSGRGKSMYRETRVVLWCLVAIVTATAGAAQIAPGASTIQSTATATIDVVPDYVDFWLHRAVTADNFAMTMVEVLEFGPALRKAISKDKLAPSDQLIMAPSIADINSGQVSVSAKLRFNMSAYTDHEAGPRLFAALCDKILGLSEQLECSVEGPFLELDDRRSVEQTAQERAIENALAPAQSAAELMDAEIIAVDRIDMGDCVWNEDPARRTRLPTMRRLTCSARVRVTYTFAAKVR